MPYPSRFAHPFALLLAPPLVAVLAALALWLELPPETVMAITGENGPIELPSALLWFALAFGIWRTAQPPVTDRLAGGALRLLFAAFGARELDLHKAWTTMSILKSRFYVGHVAPAEKLAGLVVVGTLAVVVLMLLTRYRVVVWRELRQRTPWSFGVATFVATLVIAKLLDRAVYGYGLPVTEGGHALVVALEELLELSLPVIAGIGLLLGLRPHAVALPALTSDPALAHHQPPLTHRR